MSYGQDFTFTMCIRCDDAPAVDDMGYCGHCHWAARAEVEEGFWALKEWLKNTPLVGYAAYCREHNCSF